MTALGVIVGVVVYLLVGAVYARSQVLATYKRAKAEWNSDSNVRDSVQMATAFRTAFWPLFMPVDTFRGPVSAWFIAPVDDRKREAVQLRADAKAWRMKRNTGTPAEKAMADELARMCDERAREVDL